MNEFRLISLQLKESNEFDSHIFQFSNEKEKEKTRTLPKTTLIIGSNGTGKSRLLRVILDIFNDLYNYKTSGKANFRFKEYYLLKFQYNSITYSIENNKRELTCKNGDDLLSGIQNVSLPVKIIGAAFSISDKLPSKNNRIFGSFSNSRYDNDYYEYLGIKTFNNMASSSGHINRSIDLIVEAISDKNFQKDVKAIFKYLEFAPKIFIEYRFSHNREFLTEELSVKSFKKRFKEMDEKRSGFSFGVFKKLSEENDETINEVLDYLKKISKIYQRKDKLSFEINFSDFAANRQFIREYKMLNILRKLNIISYSHINVFKKHKHNTMDGHPLNIRDMSSGEVQILTSMLSLAAVVTNNSLVIIDEPEISLHPNWQTQYMETLNTVFKNYLNCHFLIATHSHFIVSDLKKDSSSILSLTINKHYELESNLIDYSTYGWSSENILYNVFGVTTFRNHYFEMDVTKLLALISQKSKNFTAIKKLTNKLELLITDENQNDPLKVIVSDAKKYLRKNELV